MITICFYFQAHQPFRIRELSFFEIGDRPDLFDNPLNKKILARVSKNSYLPGFDMFRELIGTTKGKFRFALSATGVLLEQMENSRMEAIDSLRKLLSTGSVELLGETYYHSFASLYSLREFEDQVLLHKSRLKSLFDIEPAVFRNTELAFRSDVTKPLEKLGFESIFIEGGERTLKGKNCNFLYTNPGKKGMKIFTRNQEYSNMFTCKGVPSHGKKKFPDTAEIVNKIIRENGRS